MHEISEPSCSGTFEPPVVESRPDTGPAISIPRVAGIMNTPASVTDEPKPNPVDFGSSTNSGTRMNDENIPNPNTSAARFVVQTARIRIIRMSTSAAAVRASTQTQTAASTAAMTKRLTVRGEVQPQVSPSLIGSSSATSQPASSAAPVQSTRP